MGIEARDHWPAIRRWVSGLLGAALLLGGVHAAAREPPPDALDLETRHRVIDDIDAAIRGHFAHWSALPEFDYDAAFAAYRADALNRPDRKAFSVRTEVFLASLNNGHTQFNDAALSAADPGDLGFRMRHIGGQWVVTETWRAELPSASVVLTLDGRPIETVYGETRARLNASNERTRRTLFTHYPALFPLAFDLGLADGTSRPRAGRRHGASPIAGSFRARLPTSRFRPSVAPRSKSKRARSPRRSTPGLGTSSSMCGATAAAVRPAASAGICSALTGDSGG
jgi:hypothetical protein